MNLLVCHNLIYIFSRNVMMHNHLRISHEREKIVRKIRKNPRSRANFQPIPQHQLEQHRSHMNYSGGDFPSSQKEKIKNCLVTDDIISCLCWINFYPIHYKLTKLDVSRSRDLKETFIEELACLSKLNYPKVPLSRL